MLKSRGNKTELLAQFFCNKVTEKLCGALLTVNEDELKEFLSVAYRALEMLSGEFSKAALGIGNVEKLIFEAGKNAPISVRSVGGMLADMMRENDNGDN